MAFKLNNSPFTSIGIEEDCIEVDLGPGKGKKCKGRLAYKSNRKDKSFSNFNKKQKKARKAAGRRGAYSASWMK